MNNKTALGNIRILDFTWVLAGPYGTRFLADYGAEVIKVQSAQTMIGVVQTAYAAGYFNTYNRNKLGIALNMSKPEAREIARRLVRISDIVVENFSTRVMQNWELDYNHLKQLKPDIIMVSMSGMGHTGPWKNQVSYGPTIQALTGITYLTSYPVGPAVGFGYSYSDHIAGLTAALAAMAALEFRFKTGNGQHIDMSQLEAMASLLGTASLEYSANNRYVKSQGNRPEYPSGTPHGVYRCKGEDRWCAIAVFEDSEWKSLASVINDRKWVSDARFGTIAGRINNQDELDRLIEEWTINYIPAEVMQRLQSAGVACGAVHDGRDLAEDPQLKHRGFFVKQQHPELGLTTFDGSPIKLSETPAQFKRAGPVLGQHNSYVYQELLGMTEEEVQEYIRQEIFI